MGGSWVVGQKNARFFAIQGGANQVTRIDFGHWHQGFVLGDGVGFLDHRIQGNARWLADDPVVDRDFVDGATGDFRGNEFPILDFRDAGPQVQKP